MGMADFDLSQALENPLESDEKEVESCCFDMTGAQDEIINLDAGLDLAISRKPNTMTGVATLVLAANRMKKSLTNQGRLLSDDELCRRIMDSVIETTIVKTAENSSTGNQRIAYVRLRSWECNLTDAEKKDIVCATKDLKLEAVTLKGGNLNHKVTFKLGTYCGPGVGSDGQTVVLSIVNHNLYITCTKNGDKAEMKLEECSADKLKSITADGNMDRFLFYRREIHWNTFESVMCRGWFISTSYENENKPLEMCQVDTACRLYSFNMCSK